MLITIEGGNGSSVTLETYPALKSDNLSIRVQSNGSGISINKDQFFAAINLLKLEGVK